MRSDHLSKHLKTHQTRKTGAVHMGGPGGTGGVVVGGVNVGVSLGMSEDVIQDQEEECEEGEENPDEFGGDSCDLAMSVDETDQDNDLSINETGMDAQEHNHQALTA
uniref:Zinc finger transcription factor Sp1-4 n=1 Tax=Phalangium opilio TaxID=118624 RepID=A0A2R4FYD3_PHAOP|nr:zinc finger transcription factor Sp1-4 [Phalangium opilio]